MVMVMVVAVVVMVMVVVITDAGKIGNEASLGPGSVHNIYECLGWCWTNGKCLITVGSNLAQFN